MPKKVLSYEDKKFEQGNSLVASLQQAFVDFKSDKEKIKSWNMPIADLNGVTLKILNNSEMCLTWTRVEVGSIEQMATIENNAKKFLKEVEKELKARFKKLTGKSLEVKKKKEDRMFEKYQSLYADTSWMLGYGRAPIAKFFVRDTIHYTYSSDVAL
jgi:SMC interacting uncharacterized protein involved in chromosome segregation